MKDIKNTKSKYTIEGDAAFDEVLDEHLEHVVETVKNSVFAKDILAVVLGGGYGRGEGEYLEVLEAERSSTMTWIFL